MRIRVQAGARKEQILSYNNEILRVAVQAPAVEGAANRALIDLLARSFHIGRSQVRLVHGHKGRNKTVELVGLAPRAFESALQGLLDAHRDDRTSHDRTTGDGRNDRATKANR